MSLKNIRQNRIDKIIKLRKLDINPYSIYSEKTATIEQIIKNKKKIMQNEPELVLAGRVRGLRPHGGSVFLHIEENGKRLQLFLRKNTLGEDAFKLFNEIVDVGDYIETRGHLFFTKTKELTLEVKNWRILTKSLRPLPDKWRGLKDNEIKYRKRYLDLLTNPDLRKRIQLRSKLINCLRAFLDKNNFMEVETPILQNQAGGALARPFKTKLNALNIELYLRIAPELYHKRLIIGGFNKIYEIGKCFRNEGIDSSHNPEFTELEFYWAYSDYKKLMDFTEDMFREILKVFPKEDLSKKLSKYLNNPLPRLEYQSILKDIAGIDCGKADKKQLKALLKKEGLKNIKEGDKWTLIDEIFKKICLKKIDYPFFLIHHPLPISPLAKKVEKNNSIAARFQLIIGGLEIVNAYSELNDPLEQKERFEKQKERIQEGEKEIHPYDKDFIEALEYGMPPTAGWGMGIDRLVALLTNSSTLKEVILFPLMRPKTNEKLET
jgi:lysyl-tRNA synthetase class 2